MPMKVEAAIVTQKRSEALYNTDSVNVNGKVMPREVIKNGYKGSGILSGSAYFAVTSSHVEGFADATVEAFNERAGLFSLSRNPVSVFSGFFEDCRSALLKMNHLPEELVCTGFYGRGTSVVLVKNGDAKLYLSRLGVCTPVTGEKVEDTTASFSGAEFRDVSEGDIFVLLGPGAAKVLGDREIEDILRISDGSVKRIVNYILKVALAAGGEDAVSAIAVKVLETSVEDELSDVVFAADDTSDEADKALEEAVSEKVDAAEEAASAETAAESNAFEKKEEMIDNVASVFAESAQAMFDVNEVLEKIGTDDEAEEAVVAEEASDDAESESYAAAEADAEDSTDKEASENGDAENTAEEAVSENADSSEVQTDSSAENTGAKSKKPLFFVFGVLLALVVAAIVAFAVIPALTGGDEETTGEEITITEGIHSTTEEDTSSEEVATVEETTEELTTEESTTRKPVTAETTTKRKPAETTTAKPVVAPAETTTAEEKTTAAEATTSEEKTTAAESTTAEEKTTVAETTTVAPDEEIAA